MEKDECDVNTEGNVTLARGKKDNAMPTMNWKQARVQDSAKDEEDSDFDHR